MRKLTVENFSVIKQADFDFSGMNVIIGPQASGKSLLCKLAYFFNDIVSEAVDALPDETSLETFKQQTKDRFLTWFPVDTWAKGKFKIDYRQGPFGASTVRTSYSGSVGASIRLSLCPEFCDLYEIALKEVKALNERARTKKEVEASIRPWEVREFARKRVRGIFGGEQSETQTYIPAGRAFFTTYGKAISVFQGKSLDPVTARFGGMMEWMLEGRAYIPGGDEVSLRIFEDIQNRILRGSLKTKKGVSTFVTDDGRTLPLSHLSSGTQEALPLLASLRLALFLSSGGTVFAEEPEVHLFPSAQMELVKLFAWMANLHKQKSCWVITTHSPYILSAFNNLIEAGRLFKDRPKLKSEISKLIPERYWIKKGEFAAYCIHDGVLKPILSESGLIDGEYLDGVSEIIGNEFDSLLRLDYEHSEAS